MGVSSGFKSNNYYESDRADDKLSHSDFMESPDFEYLDGNDGLIGYLDRKTSWEKFFIRTKTTTKIGISEANTIFYTCYTEFSDTSDAVEIFSIITSYYDIEPEVYYGRLVKKCRMVLVRDLSARLDSDIDTKIKDNLNSVGQKSFNVSLKNKTL